MSGKSKTLLVLFILGLIIVIAFKKGYLNSFIGNNKEKQGQNQQNQDEEPKVISTNPENLDNAFILPNQTIEITFNLPLQNIGEFKNTIEPKTDYQVKLSDDRKTAKIIPNKPFKLGSEFTLIIGPDTKFDPKKNLNRDIRFHFRTIEYKGV